jgi:TatA/E family protein of Tat protein translocase
MFGLGFQELLLILLIGVLFFGTGRLPQLGHSLGRAIRELGKAVKEINGPLDEAPKPQPRA